MELFQKIYFEQFRTRNFHTQNHEKHGSLGHEIQYLIIKLICEHEGISGAQEIHSADEVKSRC